MNLQVLFIDLAAVIVAAEETAGVDISTDDFSMGTMLSTDGASRWNRLASSDTRCTMLGRNSCKPLVSEP